MRWTHSNVAGVAHFRVHYGSSSRFYLVTQSVPTTSVDGTGAFTHSISVPDPDTVYVAVTAVGPTGLESPYSNEAVRLGLESPSSTPSDPGTSTDSGGSTDSGSTTGDGTASGGTESGSTGSDSGSLATWSDDFEQQSIGATVSGWLDTGPNNSMSPDDSLFRAFDLSGNRVFGTTSTATNIHSHYVTPASIGWSGYEFSGRMLITDPSGGIGITVHSQYNHSDTYYRVRRYNSGSFHMAPHPDATPLSCASPASGVTPSANLWYRFRFEVVPAAGATTLRAKFWRDGSAEPAAWEVQCEDTLADRLTSGVVGLWAMGPGAKYWDDLSVVALGGESSSGSGTSSGDTGSSTGGDSTSSGDSGSGTASSGDDGSGTTSGSGDSSGSTGADSGGSSTGSTDSSGNPEPDAESPGTLHWAENFELRSISPVVPGWVDTRAGNSMSPDDSLFQVVDRSGNRVFGTTSTATNIHSHYRTLESVDWSGYELRGRMLITDSRGGVGVTVHSQYNDSDAYYRLRRYNTGAFHMAPHPDDTPLQCESGTTAVVPSANRWYRFRFEVVPTVDATTLRAKVWADGSVEPSNWQVRCRDTQADRLTAGAVGVWSMGPGAKYWDDLEVVEPTP